MRFDARFKKKHMLILCAFLVTFVLALQLVAVTAWTADDANAGPAIVILQLSNDEDTDWAVADLQRRLSGFITDDPFFMDRVVLRKTNDPYIAQTLDSQIVVYMSHGGPLGIVTGNRITSWYTLAGIISESKAVMHLLAACYSRNIIKMGSDDSGKKLYVVPESRPAEVTNVEITSAIMLALGMNANEVEEYRVSELTKAKEIIESGSEIHLMEFEQIVLNEADYIDQHYEESFTTYHKVVQYSESSILSGWTGFTQLPSVVQSAIIQYFGTAWSNTGTPYDRTFLSCEIKYVRNYYYEAWWVEDPEPPPEYPDPPPPDPGDPYPTPDSRTSPIYREALIITGGHWENEPSVFISGLYTGQVKYDGSGSPYAQIVVNVTASGPTIDAGGKTVVDSIALEQVDEGGVYVELEKISGVWQDPIIGRTPTRTAGSWTDPAFRADFEYDSTWPVFPGTTQTTGAISSTGDYITITGIPTGSSWHGPTFVQTLTSYFKLGDFESISANLSLVHSGSTAPVGLTAVALYDSNKMLAVALYVADYWAGTAGTTFIARYYEEDGTSNYVQSSTLPGDISGICKVYFDPLRGVFGIVPGMGESQLYKPNYVNTERLITHIAIQSYRYGSETEHNERIYGIRVSCAACDYTVFHDGCNDMYGFEKDLDFGYGTITDGTIEVPSGQSYMKLTSVASGTGWHGPNYVQTLDRPFRLYQLTEFSVVAGLTQGTSSLMGKMIVGLFDENKNCIMKIEWADDYNAGTEGYLKANFYTQSGAQSERFLWYGDSSMQIGVQMWWDNPSDGYGGIYVHSDVAPYDYLLGKCYNVSRVVKYIVIAGQRYGSNSLVDLRIHDISVVVDPNKEGPPFIDDCTSNGYFPLDNSFPWGVTTSGSLSVGSGYLYPTGIPTSPTGWHGPDFIHTLSTPFELNELSEFSVNGELVQHSSQMGKMLVALFDENKEIVLMVYWGDSWISSTKGYFHVAYYPQGGVAQYDSTGYIYSSINRIGKLWVHNGVMQYEIPGYASGNMGAIANPNRVIKYVAIRCERYSSYTISDLRLHHITVTHGLQTGAAPEYVEADGTASGSVNPDTTITVDPNQYEICIDSWWTGWWPRLHIRFSRSSPDGPTFTIQVGCGLIPIDFAFEEISVTSGEPQDPLSDPEKQDDVVDNIAGMFLMFPTETIALWIWSFATGLVCQMCQTGCASWLIAVAAGMIIIYVAGFVWLLSAYISAVRELTSNPWVMFYTLLLSGIMALFGFFVFSLILPIIAAKFILYKIPIISRIFKLKQTGVNDWLQSRTDPSWVFLFIKLILVATTFAMALLVSGMMAFGGY